MTQCNKRNKVPCRAPNGAIRGRDKVPYRAPYGAIRGRDKVAYCAPLWRDKGRDKVPCCTPCCTLRNTTLQAPQHKPDGMCTSTCPPEASPTCPPLVSFHRRAAGWTCPPFCVPLGPCTNQTPPLSLCHRPPCHHPMQTPLTSHVTRPTRFQYQYGSRESPWGWRCHFLHLHASLPSKDSLTHHVPSAPLASEGAT